MWTVEVLNSGASWWGLGDEFQCPDECVHGVIRVCHAAVWGVGGGEDINDGLHGGLLRMVVVGLGLPVRVVVTTPH